MRCSSKIYLTQVKGYPANPKSIGEMIRKRRLDLNLSQVGAAGIIGGNEMTVVNWEKGHSSPRIHHMAKVTEFLGFNPFDNGATLSQRLVNHRQALGMTQKEFSCQIEVNQSTLAHWERGEREPESLFLARLEEIFYTSTSEPRRSGGCSGMSPRNETGCGSEWPTIFPKQFLIAKSEEEGYSTEMVANTISLSVGTGCN